MAEGQRMTSAYVVAQVRDGRLEDFVCEAVVVLVARELMEAEISAEIGAERDEVAPTAAHRVRLRRRRVRQGRHGDALPGRAAMSPTAASKPPSRWSFRSVGAPMSGATRKPRSAAATPRQPVHGQDRLGEDRRRRGGRGRGSPNQPRGTTAPRWQGCSRRDSPTTAAATRVRLARWANCLPTSLSSAARACHDESIVTCVK